MAVLIFGLCILLLRALSGVRALFKEREQFELALREGEGAEATLLKVTPQRGSWAARLFGHTAYSHRVSVLVDGAAVEDDLYGVCAEPMGEPGDTLDVVLHRADGEDDLLILPRGYDFATFLRREAQYIFVEYAIYVLMVVVVWWFLPR